MGVGVVPTCVKEMERCVIKAVHFADLSTFGWGLKGMEWTKSLGFLSLSLSLLPPPPHKNNKMDLIRSHGVHDHEA